MSLAQSKTILLVTDAAGNPVANASIELEKTGTFAANEKGELSLLTGKQVQYIAISAA